MGLVVPQPTPSTFCAQGIEEAAWFLGPAFMYELWVPKHEQLAAQFWVRKHCGHVQDNPLAPYLNVLVDPKLPSGAWYVGANGKYFGNTGGI